LNVADQSFAPFERFCLSALVGRHLAVTSLEIGVQDVRSGKILQEPADPAPAHYAMKTIVDGIIDADGKLFAIWPPVRIQYV
jgi:hypothetical protein